MPITLAAPLRGCAGAASNTSSGKDSGDGREQHVLYRRYPEHVAGGRSLDALGHAGRLYRRALPPAGPSPLGA